MQIHAVLLARPTVGSSGVTAEHLLDLAEMTDGSTIRRIAVGDHQGNYLEAYTALGHLSAITTRVEIGPYVTNIASRDAGVHAAALASLDALSHGRAYFVLGRGDGAVRNIGLTAASVDQVVESIRAIRDLLTTGRAVMGSGRRMTLRWPHHPIPVPLYVAAAGPRMTDAAIRAADGLYAASGLGAANVDRVRDRVAALRPREEFDVWWVTRFGIGDTREEAAGQIHEGLSSIGNHALRGASYDAQGVPRELWDRLAEYHRRYDWARKSTADGPSNVDTMLELGLDEYFLERFGIAGTPAEVVHRMRELAERGVDKVVINIHSRRALKLFMEQVEPNI